MIVVEALQPADRPAWERLFRAYIDFYGRTLASPVYDRAWEELTRGARMHVLGARLDDRLVGITHFMLHGSTTGKDVCYLQDLFTDPAARGRGVGRALIGAVSAWARERDCSRVYWLTHETNTTARRLYEAVAVNRGFIRYELDL